MLATGKSCCSLQCVKSLITSAAAQPLEAFCSDIQREPLHTRQLAVAVALGSFVGAEQLHRVGAQRFRVKYRVPFLGDVCRAVFCMVYGVSHSFVTARLAHLERGVVVPPPHALVGTVSNSITDSARADTVVEFLQLVAARFGQRLSGRDTTLLPSLLSRRMLHSLYQSWLYQTNLMRVSQQQDLMQPVAEGTFERIRQTDPRVAYIRTR